MAGNTTAGYVTLGPVRMWYDEHGSGELLVLLHPGMADARAFGPNVGPLAERFRVFTPERRGHGRTPDVDGPYSYEQLADDTAAFIEQVVGGPAHLVGCSDGACVALLTAVRHPHLVRRLVCVAGVFHHEGWVEGATELDEPTARWFAAAHAELSPDGPDAYPVVSAKLDRMHAEGPTLTAAGLAGISCRTLVMVGDDDEVRLEHAIAHYRAMPTAELAVVPGTSHGLMVEKPELVNRMIVDFLADEPVPTVAPIRRAG